MSRSQHTEAQIIGALKQVGAGICWLIGVATGYLAFVFPGVTLHILCIYKAYSDIPTKPK